MPATMESASVSNGSLWAGRIVSGIVVLFMIFDSLPKLMKSRPVVEATQRIGFPECTIVGIGGDVLGIYVRTESVLSVGLLTAIQKLIILVVPNRPSSTHSRDVQPHDGPGDMPTRSSNLQLRVAGSAPGPSQ